MVPLTQNFPIWHLGHFANTLHNCLTYNASNWCNFSRTNNLLSIYVPRYLAYITTHFLIFQPLKTFIEETTDGVILLSLGSIVSFKSKDDKKLNALRNTFAKIPQRIIWSIKGPIDGLPKNVWISDWLPQKEILAHKNVLAFISHCGLNGMYEAIYFGKPVIPLPYFGDQINNAGILATLGVAPRFNYAEHTEENLLKAINDVIKDKKYRENMELLSRKFRDELNSPAEQVVYWTEYVLRYNGSSDLIYEAVGMPWYQYLLLDVIVFIIVIIVIIAFPLHLFIKYTVKKIFYSIKTNVHSKYLNKKEN